MNPGLSACEADTLPLSYTPALETILLEKSNFPDITHVMPQGVPPRLLGRPEEQVHPIQQRLGRPEPRAGGHAQADPALEAALRQLPVG